MKILLINCILYTTYGKTIPKRSSITDCMIVGLARGFVQLGHKVTLVASSDYQPTVEKDLGFETVFFKPALTWLFRPSALPWLPQLRTWLHQHADEFDLITSSEVLSMATLTACRVKPEKLIVWHELPLMPRALFKIPSRIWYGIVAPLTMRRCRIVPRSHQARHFLLNQGFRNVSPNPVEHGIDGNVFIPGNSTDPTFLVVSRLVPLKHIDKIITAFASLLKCPDRQHFKLHIIGEGCERASLEALCQQLDVTHAVKFMGHLAHSQFVERLQRATALLIATTQDNNMVSIAEAVACGVPVLTNTVPTNAETIEELGLGIVEDNWDYTALERMIDNHSAFRNACLLSRDNFINTTCAQRLIDAYQQQTYSD